MASGGNIFNYFCPNQMAKFSACSLNNTGSGTDLKLDVKINCEWNEQKNFLNCGAQNCLINYKSFQHFLGGEVEPANPRLNTALVNSCTECCVDFYCWTSYQDDARRSLKLIVKLYAGIVH